MDKLKQSMLDWASGTDPKERIRFIAQLMTTVETEREAKAVMNAAARIKRRQRKRKYQEEEEKEAKKKKLTLTEPAPCEPEHVRIQPWWKRFDRSDVVAIDTEYVERKKFDPNTNKYLNQRTGEFVAGSVAVVDSNGRCLLNKCVKHPKWSFFVDKHTKRANGFEPHSLMNGEDFMKIEEEVAALLEDKLVIVCGGNFIDFTCLGLEPGNYEKFNLHQFFYRTFYSSRGKVDLKDIGLRSLVFQFYKIDIQDSAHSALTDATYTMKIFMDHYVKLKTENVEDPFDRKRCHTIFNDFEQLNDKTKETLKSKYKV